MRNKLIGGDLRSIAKANEVVDSVTNQQIFDDLFSFLYEENRLLNMRSADAIEKITLNHPEFLQAHKNAIFQLCQTIQTKEFKWHLALLLPRIHLTVKEKKWAIKQLSVWALNPNESKIVRANSIQSLYEITQTSPFVTNDLQSTIKIIKGENIPSLNARIRKLSVEN